jgi:ribosomal protein S18 acetylase RimI-like enzyme
MVVDVRLATARDRSALDQFYAREGFSFQKLATQVACTPVGGVLESMFVVASTNDMVVASLKLDIGKDPKLGKIGVIQHFEVEEELEDTELGIRMLNKAVEISEKKGLRALYTLVSESRSDVINLYAQTGFKEERKEIYLRKDFEDHVF